MNFIMIVVLFVSKDTVVAITFTLCGRCLLAGGRYDLQVVFRLFQLWFTLGSDHSVNAQLASSFREVPSFKLLSLVYQIASRMSAAKTGPFFESGFQVCIQLSSQTHHSLFKRACAHCFRQTAVHACQGKWSAIQQALHTSFSS